MRITIDRVKQMKQAGEKIVMLTAYDYPTARLVDQAGVPLILVGDSLGMVVLGYDSTVPVTMEDMLHHIKAVVRGSQHALVVGDLPFMSYQVSVETALVNAGRLLQEGGCQAVKLEGGERSAATVRALVESGIPVMGHIGLTPQSVNQLSGYRVQGKTPRAAVQLINDARALADAGAFAIVLESIPAVLAKVITEKMEAPTIGIGAGPFCDGQVQVLHDMLGLNPDFAPRHAKRYANLAETVTAAVTRYAAEVRSGVFPSAKESYGMDRPASLPPEPEAESLRQDVRKCSAP
ncbi:MAG: 3-methyl-2-oxobutanoate hydroxymethyltransferase [Dehalococcoidia bacterium]|nr:3-methyl-2-oxobutanoate hydroxymethyltransferase [Dehalococcoidia bacterium]